MLQKRKTLCKIEYLHGVAGFCTISNGPAGDDETAHVIVSDSGSVTATVCRQLAAVAISETVIVVGNPEMTGAPLGITFTVRTLAVEPQLSEQVTVSVKDDVPPKFGFVAKSMV